MLREEYLSMNNLKRSVPSLSAPTLIITMSSKPSLAYGSTTISTAEMTCLIP